MLNKKTYFSFLIFMMMVTTFLPIVSNNLPPFIGSFHLYAPLFILSILIFETKVFFRKNIITTLIIGSLLIIIFPSTIWTFIDKWNIINFNREYYFIFSALLAYYYYHSRNDFIAYARMVNISIVFIAITSIMTIYSSIIDPAYARSMMSNQFEGTEKVFFSRLGGGSYGFAAAVMALLPIAFFYYRNSNLIKYSRLIIVLYIILIFIALLRMQFFGNILIGVIVLILSVQGSKKIRKSLFYLSVLGIIALIVPNEVYANIINRASHYFDPSSNTYFKLTDMSLFLTSGDVSNTAVETRAARYPELLIAFLNSPFLGSSYKGGEFYIGAGAHLHWMNRLTIWGIFGFTIFIQIFIKNIKHTVKFIQNNEFLFHYFLSIGSIIAYGLIKTIAGRETWFVFFFIIPGLYYLPLMKDRKLVALNFKL